MSFSYYRCDWIHPEDREPVAIYYEVDTDGDVLRLIDVFADGRRECQSVVDLLNREAQMAARIASLVEGSFYDNLAKLMGGPFIEEGQEHIGMTLVSVGVFETQWHSRH